VKTRSEVQVGSEEAVKIEKAALIRRGFSDETSGLLDRFSWFSSFGERRDGPRVHKIGLELRRILFLCLFGASLKEFKVMDMKDQVTGERSVIARVCARLGASAQEEFLPNGDFFPEFAGPVAPDLGGNPVRVFLVPHLSRSSQ